MVTTSEADDKPPKDEEQAEASDEERDPAEQLLEALKKLQIEKQKRDQSRGKGDRKR